MNRRNLLVVLTVATLLLATSVSALAQPADPPDARPGPAVHIGAAWAAIVQNKAAAHNFMRPAPDEMPRFTVMPGTHVRVMAGATGLWLGESNGTLSAALEVYAVDAQGSRTLLGEDHVSATKEGPAFEKHPLKVPVSFDQPGEVHVVVRLTATAEPQQGEAAQDVDELEAVVTVLDPSTFGSISGRVTANDTGEGLEGLPVIAGNPELRIRRAARTDADGNYTIEGLPPGEYIVGVQARRTPYLGEIYEDAHSPDEATPVTVTEGANTPDIDFGLDRGAEISGQVTDQETGEPLAGIPIFVRRVPAAEGTNIEPAAPAIAPQALPAPERGPQSGPSTRPGPGTPGHRKPHPAAVTNEAGEYTVQGLPTGDYIVAAAGVRQGYGIEFWEEAATPEEATPVVIEELGQTVTGINFTLAPRSR
ncbi:MAG: hypothetical protein D6791_18300 [Chloroflexi bacterium]|nr:MAG: hypothetical protein D6791_18300 [Chloroflexota bacterium]